MTSIGQGLQSKIELGKLVVAFDGSEDSIRAVQMASVIASKFNSKVTIVHVYNVPIVTYGGVTGPPPVDYGALRNTAKSSGETILSRGVEIASKAGLTADGQLVESPSIVEGLVTLAEEQEASLIIVGTRGMTGIKRLVLGSVSSGLVSHARCPVMVVR
jgi:nucleotide-binding universal stress UspA family protein